LKKVDAEGWLICVDLEINLGAHKWWSAMVTSGW